MKTDEQTERKMFGKDFSYIRDIQNFSRIVGSYPRSKTEEIL